MQYLPPNRRRIFHALVTALVLSSTSVAAQTSAHLWSQRFGGSSLDAARAMAVMPSGDIVVVGDFRNTVDFGGGPLTSAGDTDIFIARFTASGAHVWSQRFGGTGTEKAYGVAVDSSGRILVTGYFFGSANFGGFNLISSGFDIFVASYNAAGLHNWSKRFGDTSIDSGNAIATDLDGNVFLTGYFNGTVDFGGGGLVSAGSNDVFLVKLDPGGVHQWSRRFGGTSIDIGTALAVDNPGNVFATGSFYDTVDFGGGSLVSAGIDDVFLVKYDATGNHVWSQRYGGTGHDAGKGLAIDASNRLHVTGYFSDTVDFGGGPLVSDGFRDVFVARYDTDGNHTWSVRGGGPENDEPGGVCMDGLGRVSVTGWFRGTADFGGGSLVTNGILDDVFLAVYDDAGAHLWSRRAGGQNSDNAYAIATSAEVGSVHITGSFAGTADFGGGNLTSAGSTDIFVARYAHSIEPLIASIADVPNDEGLRVRITFHGSGYDTPEAAQPVTHYVAFRRNDPPPAATPDAPVSISAQAGWTPVASVHAHGFAEYSIDAPAVADSTGDFGTFYSAFYIRAETTDTLTYYDSAPDSGYSVDNLVPAVPAGVAYASGVLSWSASSAPDFDHFTVYGADGTDFTSAAVVGRTASSSLDVSASPFACYFVTASDDGGNESAPAGLQTLTGTDGGNPTLALSVSNFPNPFNPRTTVRYTIPSRGPVTVTVYDARGARVATLVDRAMHDAGAYTVAWDGRVASGVYLLRIQHGGTTRSAKIILLK